MVNFKWVAFSFASGFAIAFVLSLLLRPTTNMNEFSPIFVNPNRPTKSPQTEIDVLPKIVSDERKSQKASPVETPSNEIQTSSDTRKLVNILETIMDGTCETESETLAMEAVPDIVKAKITHFISSMVSTYEKESEPLAIEAVRHFIASIISNQTDPISKRNMFDVLSVIIRKERAKVLLGIYFSCFSSLGKTDQLEILMLVKSRMEDEAYETTAVDETVLQGTKVLMLLISYS
jgi:hypothetical protein